VHFFFQQLSSAIPHQYDSPQNGMICVVDGRLDGETRFVIVRLHRHGAFFAVTRVDPLDPEVKRGIRIKLWTELQFHFPAGGIVAVTLKIALFSFVVFSHYTPEPAGFIVQIERSAARSKAHLREPAGIVVM
jgi:hypothetical protein